jgi:chemosensory pili system protein ChpA (sensor histidine kinase/response regulator)
MFLVVDDNRDVRLVLSRLLEVEGYPVACAQGGLEALAFMETRKPGLVLLDYGMPDLNGLDVLKAVRGNPRLADVPVIMFSAYGGEHRDLAMAAGANAYILKGSLDWPKILAEIVRLIGPGVRVEAVGAVPPPKVGRAG